MAHRRSSARQRLIQAATELFIAQGIAETTTRQIADRAEVNEVTLFRHFGSKHGLLLAMMEEPKVLARLGMVLGQQTRQMSSVKQAIKSYANVHLQALAQVQEFVRSLIGEAGHYSVENRRALGRGIAQANRYTEQYLANVLSQQHLQTRMPPDKLASLLNSLLLGYAVLEFSSEFHELWQDRENFVDGLVQLFLYGALVDPDALEIETLPASSPVLLDLPAGLVHEILRRAEACSLQDYALAYVLFGAGVSVLEVANLERSHAYSDDQAYWLQIQRGNMRQVPLNQWIAGQQYGYHPNNPLTQWLNSRTDDADALFLETAAQPMSVEDIRRHWRKWVADLVTPLGKEPAIEQAWATWCVDMLLRGISVEDLAILAGKDVATLDPFVQRANQQRALQIATQLDRAI